VAETLRVARVDDLGPPRGPRVLDVREMLGDHALEVSVDHGPEQCPFLSDNARW